MSTDNISNSIVNGTTGNDTITVNGNNDWLDGDGGDDTLSTNGNNDTVNGAFINFFQSYINSGVVGSASASMPILQNGPEDINSQGNNATIFGDGQNIIVFALATNYGPFNYCSSTTGPDYTLVYNPQIILGTQGSDGEVTQGNTIAANGNNDTILGNVANISIWEIAGSNYTAGNGDQQAGMVDIENQAPYNYNGDVEPALLNMGSNVITVGNYNNNLVIGTVDSLIQGFIAGSYDVNANGSANGAVIFNQNLNNFEFEDIGDNTIQVGNGNNDTIIGGVTNFDVLMQAGNNDYGPDGLNAYAGQAFIKGLGLLDEFNNIKVGNGNNDVVYGSGVSANIALIAGNANQIAETGSFGSGYGVGADSVTLYDLIISSGGNTISVGNGNNVTVFGAVQNFSVLEQAGNYSLGYDTYLGTASVFNGSVTDDGGEQFYLGSNSITVGNGNDDRIYGTEQNLTGCYFGGNNNAGTENGSIYDSAENGNNGSRNIISVGNGSNDVIYGTFENATFNIVGGNNNVNNPGTTGSDNGSVNAEAGENSSGDIITVGNGSDVIYGGGSSVNVSITGGSENQAGNGLASDYNIKFNNGGNSITVGNGNDVVDGDVASLSISLTDGWGNQAGGGMATAQHVSIYGGGNTITVGNGNDLVYTAMDNLSFSETNQTGGFLEDNLLFSDSTVALGNGTDTVIADDILNPTGLNTYLADSNSNVVLWGNNTMSGGKGADNYIFTMIDGTNNSMSMQGTTIISNFNTGKGDVLSFGNVTGTANAPALDAQSAFVNIYVGGTLSGAIDGVAAIFNAAGNSAATAFQNAINSFIATNDPTATGVALLQDVAAYINQSQTDHNNGFSSTLASSVPAADAPQGALILQGHSTSDMGSFAEINNLHALTVEHTAVAVHH